MRGLDSRSHTALSVVSPSINWMCENPNRGLGIRHVSRKIPRRVADSTSRSHSAPSCQREYRIGGFQGLQVGLDLLGSTGNISTAR